MPGDATRSERLGGVTDQGTARPRCATATGWADDGLWGIERFCVQNGCERPMRNAARSDTSTIRPHVNLCCAALRDVAVRAARIDDVIPTSSVRSHLRFPALFAHMSFYDHMQHHLIVCCSTV